MTEAAENPRAVIGGNKPPLAKPASQAEIQADLTERYPDMPGRLNGLVETAQTVPEKIEDEATEGKVQDLIRQMRVHCSAAEGARKIEKEPYAAGGKAVDGWFAKQTDPLDEKVKGWRDVLLRRVEVYLKAKEDRERIRREEEARIAREERDRQLREAAEAEERRKEAERLRQEEERRAELARLEKERQIQLAKEAEERKHRLEEQERQAEIARKEREKREAAEAEERRKREAHQKEIDEAAAEQRRTDEEARRLARAEEDRLHAERMAELKAERQEEERKEREARDAAAEKRREALEATENVRAATAEIKDATRDEQVSMRGAERSEQRAEKHDLAAKGPAADLARTRSGYGTVGTIATRWTCRVVDYSKIPPARLWPYISQDAIDAALHRFMLQGGRQCDGAIIEQVEEARVA